VVSDWTFMRTKSLTSAAYAAGFAMVPSEEFLAEAEQCSLPGHRATQALVTVPAMRSPHEARPASLAALLEPSFVHLRDFLGGWWGGRATA
jgi:hypothetical protein